MDFSGLWIPLVTPFRVGAVDTDALARLVRHYAALGVAGFVPGGSTGEAAMLDDDELQHLLATTVDAAGGLPVIAGLSGVRPERVGERAQRLAESLPLAAFLLTAPAYVKPSQAGIAHYFETVASASPRPIVAYDIPARTGVRIEARTLLALAEHPNIVAVKDCSGDRAAAESLLADGRLALLAGNDDELFDQLARGAVGGITASAHLRTADFVTLQSHVAAGRLPEARALWRTLLPLVRAAFAEPNPAPLKAALARQGWIADELRAPLQRASAATADALFELSRR